MTLLPRALLALASGQPIPTTRHGVLIPAARIGETDIHGAIVMVETDSDIATLQKALTAGAAMIALNSWRTGAELQRLATLLSVAEAEIGHPEDGTPILAITDGILPAPAARESLAGKSRRLAGLVWDHRGLAATLSATRARTGAGEWIMPFANARAATLLTAAAAGVPTYDSLPELDNGVLIHACQQSRAEGFFGSLITKAAQMETIETLYAG